MRISRSSSSAARRRSARLRWLTWRSVTFGEAAPKSISRTNGKRGIGVAVSKLPDANTIDVTTGIIARRWTELRGCRRTWRSSRFPTRGRRFRSRLTRWCREAIFGFLFAVTVVFAFMLTIRPTVVRGLFSTLRPTLVIALSIPLSVFTGILLMSWQEMTLNFMTLGGLAISVGRVVDDSIVVLENVYRHIQAGRERWRAALEATGEVGPAIFASTMTTVVVFIPLGFIEGIVGSFFLPFALTVTFALVASLAVALTVVPVLGAYLLRPGDLPEGAGDEGDIPLQETWMQRAYAAILRWALGHRVITLGVAFLLTVSSLGLLSVIPVTLFGGGGGARYLNIELTLPPGTTLDETVEAVTEVEARLADFAGVYIVGIGDINPSFGIPGGFDRALFSANLNEDAPEDVAEILRAELEGPGRSVSIIELRAGPPVSGVEIAVTGPNYDDIAKVTTELAASLSEVDGIANLKNTVAEARDEISVQVSPARAAFIGLTTRQVGFQLGQYLIGQTVTTMVIDGETVDVQALGRPASRGRNRADEVPRHSGAVGHGQAGRYCGAGGHQGACLNQPHGRPALRRHNRRHHRGGHAASRIRGGREDSCAQPAAGRERGERRRIRRHRGGLPGDLRHDGDRHCAGLPRHGHQPGVAPQSVRDSDHAAARADRRVRGAGNHGQDAGAGRDDGHSAAHRHCRHERNRAHRLRGAAASQGDGRCARR